MLDGDAQDADVLDAGTGLRAETLELWVEQGIVSACPAKVSHAASVFSRQ